MIKKGRKRMKNYKKPEIIENKMNKFESVYADSGVTDVTPTCQKPFNQYNVDWTCKGKCQYYIHVDGWSWLNDRCALAQ